MLQLIFSYLHNLFLCYQEKNTFGKWNEGKFSADELSTYALETERSCGISLLQKYYFPLKYIFVLINIIEQARNNIITFVYFCFEKLYFCYINIISFEFLRNVTNCFHKGIFFPTVRSLNRKAYLSTLLNTFTTT